MIQKNDAPIKVAEDDIVFECPECGKSLVINREGSGMAINCPQCAELIQVPGDSLSEEEGIKEDLDPKSLALRESELKVKQLTVSLKELSTRRKYLERLRVDNIKCNQQIQDEFNVIQQSLDRINAWLLEKDSDLDAEAHEGDFFS